MSATKDRKLNTKRGLGLYILSVFLSGTPFYIACNSWCFGSSSFGIIPNSVFYPNVTTLRSGLCCRKSVCLLSVCLSVCNVDAPYSGGWSFQQYFFTAVYLCHPLTSVLFSRRSSQGNPSIGCVKRKRGSKMERFWTCRRLHLTNGTRYVLEYN